MGTTAISQNGAGFRNIRGIWVSSQDLGSGGFRIEGLEYKKCVFVLVSLNVGAILA